jgi:hypothetical protein
MCIHIANRCGIPTFPDYSCQSLLGLLYPRELLQADHVLYRFSNEVLLIALDILKAQSGALICYSRMRSRGKLADLERKRL